MANEELRAAWTNLRQQRQVANQNARTARAAVTAKFAQFARREGPNPTQEEIAQAESFEPLADALSVELDMLVKRLAQRRRVKIGR